MKSKCFLLVSLILAFIAYLPPRVYSVEGINPEGAPQKSASVQTLSKEEVRAFVLREAKVYGVNPARPLWIIDHESQDCWQKGYYDPALTGDDGISVGCFQFNIKANPRISRSCAENLSCSTKLAMQWILRGKINAWTTWFYRFIWYPNENPPI